VQRGELTPGTAAPGQALQPGRLPEVVETALDAIIVIDAGHRVVLFNTAACRMFQRRAGEMLGQPLDVLLPALLRGVHREHVARYAEDGAVARRMGSVRALSGVRSDGSEFPIEATISRAGAGDDLLMTVMVRDVTEIREAEAARQARIAHEAATRAKNEFLSRMSHELRTPLNAVLGITQLMQAQPGRSPGDAHQLGLLHTAGLQLQALIDQMLMLSRHAEEARPPPAPAEEALAEPPSGTVLYIEDNAVNALLVKELLRQWPKVEVVIAETGTDGLRVARERRPTLVLLDMHLPDMSGQAVLAALRGDPATRGITVAVLSANAMPQDRVDALAAGARAYWTKPINFPAFLADLRRLLRQAALSPPPA
jgi:PAS domain S-box-containing protein